MNKRTKDLLGAAAIVGVIFGAFDFILKPLGAALKPKGKVSGRGPHA